MDKIAYLALTYSDFSKPQIMKQFFNEENKDLYNLYIHNKEYISNKYFRKFSINGRIKIDTGWGHYSLIHATCVLLKEALKDPNNKRFILISDSHLPLYSMKTMHKKILELPSLVFSRMHTAHVFSKWWAKTPPPELKEENYQQVSQWFICGRKEAELFIEKEHLYREYFKKEQEIFTDEGWFNLMSNTFKFSIHFRDTCLVDWEESPKIMLKYGAKLTPKTFRYIKNDFIDKLRKENYLFVRKVHPFTDLEDTYYCLNN